MDFAPWNEAVVARETQQTGGDQSMALFSQRRGRTNDDDDNDDDGGDEWYK